MHDLPVFGSILLPGAMPLPTAALLQPSALLLPSARLSLGALRNGVGGLMWCGACLLLGMLRRLGCRPDVWLLRFVFLWLPRCGACLLLLSMLGRPWRRPGLLVLWLPLRLLWSRTGLLSLLLLRRRPSLPLLGLLLRVCDGNSAGKQTTQ